MPTEHGSVVDWVGKTCPYCQFPLKLADDVCFCKECGIPHHRECWEQNGGCTTFGCQGGQQQEVRAPAAAPVTGDMQSQSLRLVRCPRCAEWMAEGSRCRHCAGAAAPPKALFARDQPKLGKKGITVVLGIAGLLIVAVIAIAIGSDRFGGGVPDANNASPVSVTVRQQFDLSACWTPSYRQLEAEAEMLRGQPMTFSGLVLQSMIDSGGTILRVAVEKDRLGWDYDTVVAVLSDQRLAVYEDDIVQFWGYCGGSFTYESQAGWTITIPSVSVVYLNTIGRQ